MASAGPGRINGCVIPSAKHLVNRITRHAAAQRPTGTVRVMGAGSTRDRGDGSVVTLREKGVSLVARAGWTAGSHFIVGSSPRPGDATEHADPVIEVRRDIRDVGEWFGPKRGQLPT
jgi:hypothetical protein